MRLSWPFPARTGAMAAASAATVTCSTASLTRTTTPLLASAFAVAVVAMLHGEGGEVLSVGRKRRTIPAALKRALYERDGMERIARYYEYDMAGSVTQDRYDIDLVEGVATLTVQRG